MSWSLSLSLSLPPSLIWIFFFLSGIIANKRMYLYNHFKNKNTFTDFYFIFIYFITACLKKYLISSKFFSNRQTYALHFSLTHSPNYKLSVCVCVCFLLHVVLGCSIYFRTGSMFRHLNLLQAKKDVRWAVGILSYVPSLLQLKKNKTSIFCRMQMTACGS